MYLLKLIMQNIEYMVYLISVSIVKLRMGSAKWSNLK